MVHARMDMSIIGPVFCCMCNIEPPLFVWNESVIKYNNAFPVCLNADLALCGTFHHTKSIEVCGDLLLHSNGWMI